MLFIRFLFLSIFLFFPLLSMEQEGMPSHPNVPVPSTPSVSHVLGSAALSSRVKGPLAHSSHSDAPAVELSSISTSQPSSASRTPTPIAPAPVIVAAPPAAAADDEYAIGERRQRNAALAGGAIILTILGICAAVEYSKPRESSQPQCSPSKNNCLTSQSTEDMHDACWDILAQCRTQTHRGLCLCPVHNITTSASLLSYVGNRLVNASCEATNPCIIRNMQPCSAHNGCTNSASFFSTLQTPPQLTRGQRRTATRNSRLELQRQQQKPVRRR